MKPEPRSTLDARRHASAEAFLELAGDWLQQAEAENNLLFGVAIGLRGHPERAESAYLYSVGDARRVHAAAVMVPPRPLVISRLPAGAEAVLAERLFVAGAPISGVVGPKPDSRRFARAWAETAGAGARLRMAQRIYRCEAVVAPSAVPGRLRPASEADHAVLTAWCQSFAVDVGEANDHAAEMVREMTAAGHLFVWDDGEPRSMARLGGDTPGGIRVLLVYTPPEARGRGWASACVAALTAAQLARGKGYTALYTDLANPTSNNIYQRIGYRAVCDSEHWLFD